MHDDSLQLLNYSNLFFTGVSDQSELAIKLWSDRLCTKTWLQWNLTSEKEQMVAIGSELEWLFGLEHQNTKLSANNVRSQSGNFGEWILENGHPCRLTAAFERRGTSSMWCRLWKELSGEVTTATDKEYAGTLARKASWQSWQPTICNPFAAENCERTDFELQ